MTSSYEAELAEFCPDELDVLGRIIMGLEQGVDNIIKSMDTYNPEAGPLERIWIYSHVIERVEHHMQSRIVTAQAMLPPDTDDDA